MGSSQSSSQSGTDYHGHWRSGTHCSCSTDNWYSTWCVWEKVGLWNGFARLSANVGRVILLGTAEIAMRGRDIAHESIYVSFKCQQCGANFSWTYELMKDNSYASCGSYLKVMEIYASHQISRPWSYFQGIFLSLSNRYDLVERNCQHWAQEFWNRI
uniref:Yippee domain-containing protein n=1 Tax=Panagrolaimus sp. PS1159 TaxID=55785 RepID=A0AC35GFZ7_9BILA